MSFSRRYMQKRKQSIEYDLIQYALSYGDAFRPCSRVSSGDNNTICTALTQNIHIRVEWKRHEKKFLWTLICNSKKIMWLHVNNNILKLSAKFWHVRLPHRLWNFTRQTYALYYKLVYFATIILHIEALILRLNNCDMLSNQLIPEYRKVARKRGFYALVWEDGRRTKSVNFQILHTKKQFSAYCRFKISKTNEKDRELASMVPKCATCLNIYSRYLHSMK